MDDKFTDASLRNLLVSRILAFLELDNVAPESELAVASPPIPNESLSMMLSFVNKEPMPTELLLCEKENKCKFVLAALSALEQGTSPVTIGHLLMKALLAPGLFKCTEVLTNTARGGFMNYIGQERAAKLPLRHCHKSECTLYDGKIYRGPFVAGRMSGEGSLYTTQGKPCYKGEFFENRPHGKGKLFDEAGELHYDGLFAFGQAHGTGTMYSPLRTMHGEWSYGQLTCRKGRITIIEPRKYVYEYVGEIVNMEYAGNSVLKVYRADGCNKTGDLLWMYEGSFHRNRMHGVGLLTNKTHFTFGVWASGDLRFTLMKWQVDSTSRKRNPPTLSMLMAVKGSSFHETRNSAPLLRASIGIPEMSQHKATQANLVNECGQYVTDESSAANIHNFIRKELLHTNVETSEKKPLTSKSYNVSVWQLCTLSDMPRRDCVLSSRSSVDELLQRIGKGRLLFTNDGIVQYSKLDTSHPLASLVPEKVPYLYMVKCACCASTEKVEVARVWDDAVLLECTTCAPQENARALLCLKCARSHGQQKLSFCLFRVAAGLRHLQGIHSLLLDQQTI